LEIGRDSAQQPLTQRRARPASGAGARRLLELRERVDAMIVNRMDDRALGHADASAHRGAVGHLGDIETGIRRWRWKQQLAPMSAEIGAAAEPVHVAMAV